MTRNSDELYKALLRARRALPAALSSALDEVADDIRESVSVPGGGTPAAPGQAPHLQTGELAESIKGKSKGTTGKVSAGSDHAGYLEGGTSEMEPRPFFRDGVLKSATKHLPDKVADHVVKAERGKR